VVGLAYHAGALKALDEAGYAPADAELMVGTSAGAVVASYLRSGWSVEDFWLLAQGSHPIYRAMGEGVDRDHQILAPAFRTPPGLMRRSLGAAFVMARSVVRAPVPNLPPLLRHAFPGGLFAMPEGKRRFAEELPAAWPERPLWLVAFDIRRGRRVVLGREGAPTATLQQAVAASCAIPGLYSPVGLSGMTLVDGGVWSTTNLDLVVRDGCTRVVCVAPAAYDPAHPPSAVAQLVRQLPTASLGHEAAAARRAGIELVLVRPTASEVRLHGLNLMRADSTAKVAQAAYEATLAALPPIAPTGQGIAV